MIDTSIISNVDRLRKVPSDSFVGVFVEAEGHLGSAYQDRTPDQVRILHHQIDGVLFRRREGTLLEYRAARADEVEETVLVDVLLQEVPCGRRLVDVDLFDRNLLCVQETPGVLARGSGRLRVEERLGHPAIVAR